MPFVVVVILIEGTDFPSQLSAYSVSNTTAMQPLSVSCCWQTEAKATSAKSLRDCASSAAPFSDERPGPELCS